MGKSELKRYCKWRGASQYLDAHDSDALASHAKQLSLSEPAAEDQLPVRTDRNLCERRLLRHSSQSFGRESLCSCIPMRDGPTRLLPRHTDEPSLVQLIHDSNG